MHLAILSAQANTQPLSFVEKSAGLDALFIGIALHQIVSIPAVLEEGEPAVFLGDNGGQLYSEPDMSELPPCSISRKPTDIEGLIEHETSLSSPPLELTENHSLLVGSAYIVRKNNGEDESSDEGGESSDEVSESSDEESEDSDEESEDSDEESEDSDEGSENSDERSESSDEGMESSDEGMESSDEGMESSDEESESSTDSGSDSCTAMEVSSEEVIPPLLSELSESTISSLNDRILAQDIAGIKEILETQKNTHSDLNPMYTALKTLNPDIFRMLLNAGFDPNLAFACTKSPIAYLVQLYRYGVPCNTAAPLDPKKAGPCVQQFLNRNTNWLTLSPEPSEPFHVCPRLLLLSPFCFLLRYPWEKHNYLREAVLKEIEAQGYGFKHPLLDKLTFELATNSFYYSCKVLRWALNHGASTEADGIVGVEAPKAKQLRLLIRYIYWRWGPLKGSAVQYSGGVKRAVEKALVLLEAGADCLELTDIDPMPLLMIILMEPKRPYHGIYSSIPTLSEFYFLRLRRQALLQLEKKDIDLNSEYFGANTFLELLEEHQSQISSGTFIQLYFHGVQLNGSIPSSSLEKIKQKLERKYTTNLQLRSLHEALKAVKTWQALFSLPCSQIVIRQCLKNLF